MFGAAGYKGEGMEGRRYEFRGALHGALSTTRTHPLARTPAATVSVHLSLMQDCRWRRICMQGGHLGVRQTSCYTSYDRLVRCCRQWTASRPSYALAGRRHSARLGFFPCRRTFGSGPRARLYGNHPSKGSSLASEVDGECGSCCGLP